jgi:AcrR family transcriptional regulator
MTSTPAASPHRPGRRRNPRGQGERLREEIVEAAATLVVASGDARELTLRRIAKEVGIATTSVYLHFPDIDHLKVAIVERGYAVMDAARETSAEGILDPVARLLARCRAYCRFAVEHPGYYRLMYGHELPAGLAFNADQSPGRRALGSLADSIQQCQQAGLTDHVQDPMATATLAWATLHGLASLRIDRPNFPWPPLEEMTDAAVSKIVGLGAGGPSAPSQMI